MYTNYGDVDAVIPRYCKGDHESQLKKNQNTVSQDMEDKIFFIYEKGMTIRDIGAYMHKLYNIDVPDSTIRQIADKILWIIKEWWKRPLKDVYSVVIMDVIYYDVRSERRIVRHAVYLILGIDMRGKKDVLE